MFKPLLVKVVLVDVVSNSRMKHIADIFAGGQPVSYFGAAYINKRGLDNVSLKFSNPLGTPEGAKSGKIPRAVACPVHNA